MRERRRRASGAPHAEHPTQAGAVVAPYRAPRWLPGGHAQTIWPYRLRRAAVALRRERVETPDGDFWEFDWIDAQAAADAPLVVLFHGLEGGSASHYARALLRAVARRGWRGVVAHFRGCGGAPNRLPRAYHSGDHAEIGAMLAANRAHAPTARVHAVGVSLGGSALLNWLGRAGDDAARMVTAAAAVSAPLDLMAAGVAIDAGVNRIYARHFLATLKPKSLSIARRFPGVLDPARIRRARTMWDFDEAVTAPLHGFAGTRDYWTRASSRPWLAKIRVPTLVLNARNDPFIPARSLPAQEDVSDAVTLEQPRHGGHAGFAAGPFPGNVDWLPSRLLHYFSTVGGAAPSFAPIAPPAPPRATPMPTLPPEIFKAYDIRGIVGRTLTPAIVRVIGQALATLAAERGRGAIAIGRDGRLSGPELLGALSDGIRAAGIDVIDVGMVATPMAYFAAQHLGTACCVMVTGSHNPPDYNGLKMVIDATTLSGDDIQALRARIERGDLRSGSGASRNEDIAPAYFDRITGDVHLARPMRIAVDCGNGVAGAFAPELYRRLGCEVVELYCDVDGTFPNHHPDPSQPANLEDLKRRLRDGDCELGLAFDGDGDRLGVVTPGGNVIFADRQLMLFAADVLTRAPGATIIYDVKSTRNLKPWIVRHGGLPLLWKTGHSLIKSKMKEVGAALAGEMSGHTFFGERWYGFDDGLYAGARLLEILARSDNPSAVLDALPDAVSTPELHIPCAEGEQHALIAKLQATAKFPGADDVIRIDGLRVEYADGFGLARASNTTPMIVLRFEAGDRPALERIQREFRRVLTDAKPGIALPF
jgi:phosphomannomutase/phosphoglucomutase